MASNRHITEKSQPSDLHYSTIAMQSRFSEEIGLQKKTQWVL